MINLKFEKDLSQGITVIGSFYYPRCEYCDKAKELLKQNKKEYTFIQADKKFFGKVMAETKSSSVPQIIIDGEYIGGYDDLVEYFKEETV